MTDIELERERERTFIEKLQNIALWAAVTGLILLIIAQYFNDNVRVKTIDELGKEIGFALLIAAILVFTTEKRSKLEFNRLFDRHINKFSREMNFQTNRFNMEMSRRLSEFYGTVSITKVHDEINKSENQGVQLIGSQIYERYLSGLRAIQGGFHLEETDWTLESNRVFYQCLNEIDCRDGEVRITHTGTIDTWLKFRAARRTLEQQQNLARKNMKITRIFIGQKSLEESPDYRKVMEFMTNDYGIKCKYVQHDNPSSIIDMTWVPQLKLLSVWKPGVGTEVESVEITPDHIPGLDINAEWSSLLRDAKEI
jgi:hypothetical protein